MSNQSYRISTSAVLFLAATLAACGRDTVAPEPALRAPIVAPSALLASGEFSRAIVDSTDSAGNHVMVTEFAAGTYTQPGSPMKYVFKGTLNGNKLSGNYIDPLGGTGEHFTANVTFTPATKSFVGKLAFVGRCKGTATVKAKKA